MVISVVGLCFVLVQCKVAPGLADYQIARNSVCNTHLFSRTYVDLASLARYDDDARASACGQLCDAAPDCDYYTSYSIDMTKGLLCEFFTSCTELKYTYTATTYARSRFESGDAEDIDSAYGIPFADYIMWMVDWASTPLQQKDRLKAHSPCLEQDLSACLQSLTKFTLCCARGYGNACDVGTNVINYYTNAGSKCVGNTTCTDMLVRVLEVWGATFAFSSTSSDGLPDSIVCPMSAQSSPSRAGSHEECSLWEELAHAFPLNVPIWVVLSKMRAVEAIAVCEHEERSLGQLIHIQELAIPGLVDQLLLAVGFIEVTLMMLKMQTDFGYIREDVSGKIRSHLEPWYMRLHIEYRARIYRDMTYVTHPRWPEVNETNAAMVLDARPESVKEASAEDWRKVGSKVENPNEIRGTQTVPIDEIEDIHVAFAFISPETHEGSGSLSGKSSIDSVSAARATINSLLKHTKATRIVFHVLGDASPVNELRQIFVSDARAEFIVVPLERAAYWLARMPHGCSERPSTFAHWGDVRVVQAVMSRLFLAELLPTSVRQVLVLDVGDVLVFGDVAELFHVARHNFSASQAIGMAAHVALRHTIAADTRKRAFLNGGLVMLDLDKLRKYKASEAIIAASWSGEARHSHVNGTPNAFCAMLDQDVWNELLRVDMQGKWLFMFPCSWNYIPVGATNGDTFAWNQQELWPDLLFDYRVFPGLLQANRMIHYCGGALERIGFRLPYAKSKNDYASLRRLSMLESRVASSGGQLLGCRCGEEVHMVHMMGHFRYFKWVRELLSAWAREPIARVHTT